MSNPVRNAIASALGRALRNRRAGDALSVGRRIEAPNDIELRSAAFVDGAPIPDRFAGVGRGDNQSPPLEWSGVPASTRQLVLVMEDTDVPLRRPVIHLAALLEPETTSLAEGALAADAPGVRFVAGWRGRTGYHGPRALPGHGTHTYDLYLFALDAELPLDLPDLEAAIAPMSEHVLARGHLRGTQRG